MRAWGTGCQSLRATGKVTSARLERLLRISTMTGFVCLLTLSAWTLWLALPGSGMIPAMLGLLLALPLLLPLGGLARGRRYTAVWSMFLLAPYLALGLTEVVANPAARPAATGVIVAAFAVSILLIAWLRISRVHSGS